jgi:hypothetical protein
VFFCSGSKFFQKHLVHCTDAEKELIFEQISRSLFGKPAPVSWLNFSLLMLVI